MTKQIKTTNEYSGESAMLTPEEYKLFIWIKEAALYDKIKQDEKDENYTDMQKGLDKFSRLNPKAYMTLLD